MTVAAKGFLAQKEAREYIGLPLEGDGTWRRTSMPMGSVDVCMDRLFPTPNPHLRDGPGWVRERMGEFPWSCQRSIMDSVRDNRHTAVRSCHDTGKSFIASRIASWWLDVHPVGEAFVVTTAPTQPQVNAILWREMRTAHRKGGLRGRITLDAQWYMGQDELVAFGRKPADYADAAQASAAFQGIHARYVLVILDEACGVPKWLFDAAESLATNASARILAIGNPDDPATEFGKVCEPGSGWHVIGISAFDTPNFTDEHVPEDLRELLISPTWVEERRRRWGELSPLYTSKVLGQFPDVSDDTLIQPRWIRAAMERDRSGEAVSTAGRYGCDIADSGSDETVIYFNRAGYVRIAEMDGRECSWRGQETMQTVGQIRRLLLRDRRETSAVVDNIGVGSGVLSRLAELNLPAMGFKASHRAYNPDRFINRRSEQWWCVRELFEQGLLDVDPDDEDLLAQLGSIKWKVRSTGQIQVEPKEETVKRIKGSSPDRADAFMMSCVPWDALPPIPERRTERRKRTTGVAADIMERDI